MINFGLKLEKHVRLATKCQNTFKFSNDAKCFLSEAGDFLDSS